MMDTITILVPPKGTLPQINGKLPVSSALSSKSYELTVKKILGLRWNKSGDLIVEVRGTKKQLK
jgi:hypothetical protein